MQKTEDVRWGLHLLEVEITTRCNLDCAHCYNRDKETIDMPLSQIICLIKEAENHAVSRFVVSGGEATLHPGFLDLAAYLKSVKRNLKTVIQSNGLIGKINPSLLEGFDIVHLSFEPDDSEIRKSSEKKILQIARRLMEHGIYAYLFTTIHRKNINLIERLINEAKHSGVDIGFNLCMPTNREDLVLSPKDKAELIVRLNTYYQQGMILRFTSPYTAIVNGQFEKSFVRIKGGCTAGIAACVVTPSGDILPCPFFRIKAGTINEAGLGSAWLNSEVFQKLRNRNAYEEPCGSCEFLAYCGGCRARAYVGTGKMNGFDPDCPRSLINK